MLRSAEIRRKPLRTYGRQQVSPAEDANEPRATKRRRVSEADEDDGDTNPSASAHVAKITKEPVSATRSTKAASSPATLMPSSTKQKTLNLSKTAEVPATQPALPALPPTAATAKKATITSYFRVVPHLNSDSSSCAGNHQPTSDISASATPSIASPPSSPPPLASSCSEKEARARRRPRRLTTKVKPRETSRALQDHEDGTDDEAEEPTTRSQRGRATASPKQGSEHQAAGREQDREVLSSKTPSTLNRETPVTTASAILPASAAANPRKRQRARAEPAMVQQTLSLSMSEKGFTECKECSMLYNPLHEKDRRFHARQHAAILKAREMKENEEDD